MWSNLQRDILEDFVSLARISVRDDDLSVQTSEQCCTRARPEFLKERLRAVVRNNDSWTTAELIRELELPSNRSEQSSIGRMMRELGWLGRQERPRGPGARRAKARTVFRRIN